MGKVKAFMMQQEEKFWEEAHELIGDCESLAEYLDRAKLLIKEYVYHIPKDQIKAELIDCWEDYWSDYDREYSMTDPIWDERWTK